MTALICQVKSGSPSKEGTPDGCWRRWYLRRVLFMHTVAVTFIPRSLGALAEQGLGGGQSGSCYGRRLIGGLFRRAAPCTAGASRGERTRSFQQGTRGQRISNHDGDWQKKTQASERQRGVMSMET